MSIKIYDGFKLKTITTLEGALDFAKKLAPQFESMADHYFLKLAVNIAVAHLDNDLIKGKNTLGSNLSYYGDANIRLKDDEYESMKTHRVSITNVDVELAFAPAKIKNKKAIVGIPLINNREFKKFFTALDEVEDYCYYDNTDEPEDISYKEFKYRGKIWDMVFGRSYQLSTNMFRITLTPEGPRYLSHAFIDENFTQYIPLLEKRIESCASELTLFDFLQEGTDNQVRQHHEYFEFRKTAQYESDMKANRKKIQKLIPKEITQEMLFEIKDDN